VDFSAQREFEFTRDDFDVIRAMIYEHAGISIAPTKQELVYTRIRKRVREHGLTSFGSYIEYLKRTPGELQAFINSLTTNFTAFFRERDHFAILRRFAEERNAGGLRLWCAASSTGEEPYSIAMTLAEAYGTLTPDVKILASDIDTDVLAKARRGIYPEKSIENLDQTLRKRYFLRGTGRNAGSVRVIPELCELITYRQVNLLHEEWDVDPEYDVIFCRNVMFYFDKPTQRGILEKLRRRLHPEGLLFTGHSENFFSEQHLFRSVGHSVYQPAVSPNQFGAGALRSSSSESSGRIPSSRSHCAAY
jgi:chemotaxis protein methyltransferase CheR